MDGLTTNVCDLFQLNPNVQYLIIYADEDNDAIEDDPSKLDGSTILPLEKEVFIGGKGTRKPMRGTIDAEIARI